MAYQTRFEPSAKYSAYDGLFHLVISRVIVAHNLEQSVVLSHRSHEQRPQPNLTLLPFVSVARC